MFADEGLLRLSNVSTSSRARLGSFLLSGSTSSPTPTTSRVSSLEQCLLCLWYIRLLVNLSSQHNLPKLTEPQKLNLQPLHVVFGATYLLSPLYWVSPSASALIQLPAANFGSNCSSFRSVSVASFSRGPPSESTLRADPSKPPRSGPLLGFKCSLLSSQSNPKLVRVVATESRRWGLFGRIISILFINPLLLHLYFSWARQYFNHLQIPHFDGLQEVKNARKVDPTKHPSGSWELFTRPAHAP